MNRLRERLRRASPGPEVVLAAVVAALTLVLVFLLAAAPPEAGEKAAEMLPVSISSKQAADYAASSTRLPAAGVRLVAEVIRDQDPDADVAARYTQVLDDLLTPVPGGPPKPTAAPSPTPGKSGVFVTNIRLDPASPKQDEPITFYVSFQNTTGSEQTYRWFVFIYRQGQSQPFGQTSSDRQRVIPPGASEQAAVNTWKMGSSDPCVALEARVNREETGGRPTFEGLDGQPFTLKFTLCK